MLGPLQKTDERSEGIVTRLEKEIFLGNMGGGGWNGPRREGTSKKYGNGGGESTHRTRIKKKSMRLKGVLLKKLAAVCICLKASPPPFLGFFLGWLGSV
jgi:hypothetical protein